MPTVRVEYALGGSPCVGTDDFGAFDYPQNTAAEMMTDQEAIARAARDLADTRDGHTGAKFLVIRRESP